MSATGVLHVDLGHDFRGGQRQCFNLVSYLKENGVPTACVVHEGGELQARLADLDIPIFPIDYGGFDIVAESIRLRNVCSKMGYGIVHAHDSHGHNIALTLKFLSPGVRVIVTRRVLSDKNKSLVSKWKYTNRSIDKFVAVSRAVERQLVEWGVSDSRVVQIPSGVELDRFKRVDADRFVEEYRIPKTKYVIGTACALDDNKDVATLLTMAAKLAYAIDDFVLLVAGQGDKRDELERMATFIEINEKIRFLGFVPRMPEFYSALDVFMLSSRSEGLGTSVLEAGACGCAVVASRCGGPEDYIEHDKNGFLFDIEDDNSLTEIIKRLLLDEDLRRGVVERFSETLQEYEYSTVSSRIMDEYRRLAIMAGD